MQDNNQVWPFILSEERQEAACCWHWTEEKRKALWGTENPKRHNGQGRFFATKPTPEMEPCPTPNYEEMIK